MKRILSLALAAVLLALTVCSFASCSAKNDKIHNPRGTYTRDLEGTTLTVYNWAEYISNGEEGSLDVVAAFENLTGIQVNYVMYESNEVMYNKITSGSAAYDVIIPSDYMIDRMRNENLLKKLDFSKLSNYQYIDPMYKGAYFDEKEEYSVPYSVGLVGMIYNSKMVEGKPDSWSLMWDTKYKGQILNFNNPRDAFMIAQMLEGIDINTEDKSEWDRAYNKLVEQKDVLQGWVMDEVFNKMESGNAAVATYYAGDFLTMKEENEDLEFVYPKEGTNIFIDSVCIPSCVQNYEAALMFINFLMEPEVALANAEYIRYATPNMEVLKDENYSLKDNEYLYPKNLKEIKKEYYQNLDPEIIRYYEDLFIKVKSL